MVGEDLRAVGSTENARQVDHAQSGHGACGTIAGHLSFLVKLMKIASSGG
jgi:hypothetical protein